MPLEVTLFVVDDGEVRILDVTGFSVESNERIVNELEDLLSERRNEASAVCRVAWHLYGEYPATSWSILIRYSDGRNDGRLTYTSPGELSEGEQVPTPKPPHLSVDRVSRYARKPVI